MSLSLGQGSAFLQPPTASCFIPSRHTTTPAAGSSCTWCRTPCRTRSSLRRRSEDTLRLVSEHKRGPGLFWWDFRWAELWTGCPRPSGRGLYLRCSHVTVGHGETTEMAGRASLQPSHCTWVAEPAGTQGIAPSLDPGGPKGSKEPEDMLGRGGVQVDSSVFHCWPHQTCTWTHLLRVSLIEDLELTVVLLVVNSWLVHTWQRRLPWLLQETGTTVKSGGSLPRQVNLVVFCFTTPDLNKRVITRSLQNLITWWGQQRKTDWS